MKPTMNDPIKYLITGAAIAIVCGAAGTMGGVWLMKEMGSGQRSTVGGKPPIINLQPPGVSSQSVFSSQRIQQNPTITIPPRPANGSNIAFRPSPVTGKMPITYNQFQKLQEQPEVKKARDEFMEAQRRYSETMKKAMEAKKTEGSGQMAVGSSQKAEDGGRKTDSSGQPAGK